MKSPKKIKLKIEIEVFAVCKETTEGLEIILPKLEYPKEVSLR